MTEIAPISYSRPAGCPHRLLGYAELRMLRIGVHISGLGRNDPDWKIMYKLCPSDMIIVSLQFVGIFAVETNY